MDPVTTPESPRNQWPARKIRLDDQTWHAARLKLAQDSESWQGVMEVLALAWLNGAVNLETLRTELTARGLVLPEK